MEFYHSYAFRLENVQSSGQLLRRCAVFDRNHPVVLYQYNSILVSLQTQHCVSQNDNYQFLVRRHVSAKYSHHQANRESKFRYIKCATNGIPLCLKY